MKTTMLAIFLSLSGAGCSVVSGQAPRYSHLTSLSERGLATLPPAAPVESVPAETANQTWSPGYFEALGDRWIWHHGSAIESRAGYVLIPATYQERDGRYQSLAPHWKRSELIAPVYANRRE